MKNFEKFKKKTSHLGNQKHLSSHLGKQDLKALTGSRQHLTTGLENSNFVKLLKSRFSEQFLGNLKHLSSHISMQDLQRQKVP